MTKAGSETAAGLCEIQAFILPPRHFWMSIFFCSILEYMVKSVLGFSRMND